MTNSLGHTDNGSASRLILEFMKDKPANRPLMPAARSILLALVVLEERDWATARMWGVSEHSIAKCVGLADSTTRRYLMDLQRGSWVREVSKGMWFLSNLVGQED